MAFIGRDRELESLNDLYSRQGATACAIYGRRRIGKTSLLTEFCKNKRSLYLTALGVTQETTMDDFGFDLKAFFNDDIKLPKNPHELVELLSTIDGNEKTVVVLDEFPNLIKVFPETSAVFQKYIDHKMKQQNIMLVICGSSMSSMGHELNDARMPLFHRFPLQMKLQPLPYREARRMSPGLSEEDRIRIYCIASGIPLYHEMFGSMTPKDGIEKMFLGKTSWMVLEADNVVSMELNPPEVYSSILTSVRGGASLESIVNSTGISESSCWRALNNLITLGFVEKDVCFGKKRKTLYKIGEGFIGFRYDVLIRNENRIAMMDADRAYDDIKTQIDSFYDHRFGSICKEYVASTENCRSIGSWWGAVPVTTDGRIMKDEKGKVVTEDADIDIVAITTENGLDRILLGECKFTNKLTGIRELERLIQRGEVIREWPSNRRYIMFSRSGFTDSLRDYLEEHGDIDVKLVSMDDIKEWAESSE